VSDEEWSALVAAMDTPDWTTTYATRDARLRNIETLHQHLGAWTAAFDDRELADKLQRAGVPAAPVLNVADLLHDPHFSVRKTFVEVDHPLGFRETIYGAYVKTSRSRAVVKPGPWMGQDNERVFKQLLGVAPARFDDLVAAEVIY
jgi:benzylsuccinate CoA-transferase BbsF subunit